MNRRTALAFNALSQVLSDADCFVRLGVRWKATEAALAAADAEVPVGTPLVCSDERHAAKVAALEAELAATADDLRWALDLLHEHIHAPGPVDEDGELCDYCARMARARQRLGDGPCAVDVRVSVDPPSSFYSDETTLSVRYAGGQVFKVLACRACGMAQHFGISCEDVAESRRTFAELVDAAVAQVLDGSCDHRDPNRLGHRPSDLATVCACGKVLFPSPLFTSCVCPPTEAGLELCSRCPGRATGAAE